MNGGAKRHLFDGQVSWVHHLILAVSADLCMLRTLYASQETTRAISADIPHFRPRLLVTAPSCPSIRSSPISIRGSDFGLPDDANQGRRLSIGIELRVRGQTPASVGQALSDPLVRPFLEVVLDVLGDRVGSTNSNEAWRGRERGDSVLRAEAVALDVAALPANHRA
jgi:hypothetical protein